MFSGLRINIFLLAALSLTLVTAGYSSERLFIFADSTGNGIIQGNDTTSFSDTAVKKRYDVDSVIYTTGTDSIIFRIRSKKMEVHGKGDIRYKETKLKSGRIYIDFETDMIEAYGKPPDSATGKTSDLPVLNDKGEEYTGTQMRYNYKTTRGFITYAKTDAEDASYSGAKIKKVDKTTLFVENGVYTTCEADEPHYYFFSSQMKVIQKEQMMGKWIWLAFGNVPFPIPLPFAIIPLQSGRRSGILAPAYGERAGYGKYFSRFGYFWAISDYMDLALTGDYYTKGGYAANSRFRYAKRYDFTGNLDGNYSDLVRGEETDPDREEQKNWSLSWVHNQAITPTSRFDMNLFFMSSNYFRENSIDYNQLLTNEIVSNANYYTTWEESGASLSLNYKRNQNLSNGNITEYLPSLSFSKSQFYPFRGKSSIGDQKWYEYIGISYNGQLQNRRIKESGNFQSRGGIQHSVGFSASPKWGYITITPSVSYRELWYNKRIERKVVTSSTGSDSVVTNDINEYNFVRTFSTGVGVGTKLYGIAQVNSMGVAALRHIIQPSVSFSYTPDFSKDFWGYYDKYRLSDGTEVTYNKFEREIYGGASSRESRVMNMRVDNIFEMKTLADPRDTTSKEEKIQLLNLSADAGYDFNADSLKLSDIRLGYRTQVGQWLNLYGGSSYTIYDSDENGRPLNKILLDENKGFVRMKSFSFSASTSLSGDRIQEKKSDCQGEGCEDEETEEAAYAPAIPTRGGIYKGIYDREEVDFSIPWSISLGYNYSVNKIAPGKFSEYSTINANFNFSLTKAWKIVMSGNYDFKRKEFSAPQIAISRDLHCWLMNFTWNPIGYARGYRLEIRVKASQLQDLKVTKSDNFFSGRRY
ncbi:MAG: LPS-assembly protein LptD [Ignavibacteriaceae bacterium]|nr:LPS-assembly protein LptD [Ignavibacteriaceae bacterium]